MGNTNYIRDTFHIAMEIAYRSKVPVLFLSNPGIGKTTNLESWADELGYAVTTLIGSQRVREEILGYMTNEKGKAGTLLPDWYDEIMENHKAGKKTVLFIDEESTAPEDVQGPLLQLTFSRKIGGKGNYLPDDCVIVAAANYKGNLPPQMNLMSPTLNRYMIVNLESPDMNSLVDEFLQDEDDMRKDMVEFANVRLTDDTKTKIRTNLAAMLKRLFASYAIKDENGDNTISVRAKEFDGIYDTEGLVYNFISGRTLSYLKRITEALVSTGLHQKIATDVTLRGQIANMVYGLIGNGTCQFDAGTGKKYRKDLNESYMRFLNDLSGNITKAKAVKIDYKNFTVGQAINEWQLHYENPNNDSFDNNFLELHKKICDAYDVSSKQFIEKIKNMATSSRFVNEFMGDMQRLDNLILQLKELEIRDLVPFIEKFTEIQSVWEAYKLQSMGVRK